jgi:hypothetical protein
VAVRSFSRQRNRWWTGHLVVFDRLQRRTRPRARDWREWLGWNPSSIFLDHTGSTLYADYYTTNNDYDAYSIDQSAGALTFVNDLSGGPENNSPVSFIGSNEFGYSSSCYHFTQDIYGVQRASDGALTYLNITPAVPAGKSGGFYCPWLAAADPTNHIAIAMQPLNQDFGANGPWQIATYAAESSGKLSTASTYANMPKVDVGAVIDYWPSPSGKYLAVGGNNGLQIFRFNGANPVTKFTGPLTTVEVNQMFWDNANHLYAISRTAGKLFVWTVTATGAAAAPGSPHSIASPMNVIVLPR